MPEELPPFPSGPALDKLENFNFLLSHTNAAAKAARNYSLDTDPGLVPYGSVNVDFDQTEGMGGLSVSSYDSIEDERSSLDFRAYPYHGMCPSVQFIPNSLHSLPASLFPRSDKVA